MTTDITAKFREAEGQGPRLLLRVKGKVLNLHGQGETRIQALDRVVYSQTDTSLGPDEQAKQAGTKRRKQAEVHTFPVNSNGQIMAPLGGKYGYLLGALKAATAKFGAERAKRGSATFGIKTKIAEGVFIEPAFVELGSRYSNPPDKPHSFFITKIGVSEFFDFVAEVPVEFTIRVESDVPEDKILELLAFVQRLGIGPKRRGLLKIDSVERID